MALVLSRTEHRWFGPKDDPGDPECLPAAVRAEQTALQQTRFFDGLITAAYYGQRVLTASTYRQVTQAASSIPVPVVQGLEQMATCNLIRAVFDAACAQIVRFPDFKVQTSGATWSTQRSARKLSQWVTAVGRRNDLDAIAHQVELDTMSNTVAGARVFIEGDAIKLERARPDGIIYRDHEGPYSKTLSYHDGVPRSRLTAMYPEHADKIKGAPAYEPDPWFLMQWISPWAPVDLVEVFEAWHCSSGKGDPGRHLVVLGNGLVLIDEDWPHDFPGIITHRWANSYAGYGGTPLGYQLVPYQAQLQRMDRTIVDSLARLAIPRVWIFGAQKRLELGNTPGETHYLPAGTQAPVIQPGVALGPEFYNRRALLRQEAFEMAGVSASFASGRREADLTSGVALREYNEQAWQRLSLQAESLDRWFERVAYAIVDVAARHYGGKIDAGKETEPERRNGKPVIPMKESRKSRIERAPGSRLLFEVDWSTIDLREMGEFVIQARTMRQLPNHPSARAEMLQSWAKMGAVTQDEIPQLMGARDLEGLEDRLSAAIELADMQIGKALDDGEYIAPEPYQGQALAKLVERGQQQFLMAKIGKAPAKNLRLLHRLVEHARYLLEKTAPPPAVAEVPPPEQGGMAA